MWRVGRVFCERWKVGVCLVGTCICQYVEPCWQRKCLGCVCVMVLMTFDMLYHDDPEYGVSYLCGFIEDVPIWEKALLDCEGSVATSLHHS